MKPKTTRKIIYLSVFAGVLSFLIYLSVKPSPVPVETGRTQKGPMRVTIDEDGETRAHDRFVISAPVAGRLARIELHEGDIVKEGDSVAFIKPLPLSPRERIEVTSRVQAAEAYLKEAEERVSSLKASLEQTKREKKRAEQLAKDGLIPPQQLEQARNAELTATKDLEAARFKVRAAAAEVEVARAGMIALEPGNSTLVRLDSPVSGRVLRIVEKSERVVETAAPLLIIGDPSKLEIVVDVLSSDAVKVNAGNPVWIAEWGGDQELAGRVRVVEPLAFTKVSALGIEEQRVNVIVDLLNRPASLGDGYRVDCRIVIWSSPSVLKAPTSALFRVGEEWNVFIVEQGKARRRVVRIGHRSPEETEVLAGLSANETVILYPSNELEEGSTIRAIR